MLFGYSYLYSFIGCNYRSIIVQYITRVQLTVLEVVMALKALIFTFLILTFICFMGIVYSLKYQKSSQISLATSSKLFGSGILAFIFDTLGVGSFVVNTALAKILGTARDDEIPAINNGAQVLPGALSAFFFITYVNVDVLTLYTLVLGACIGGIIGGAVVSRLNKQSICLVMVVCFSLIAFLLIGRKLGFLSVGGDEITLTSWKLLLGFLGMILSGILSSAGVGLFAIVQGVLFLLDMSPIVAFPIMMVAGAMQQPLTTMMFLKQGRIPIKKTLILTIGGCIGVLIILPVFKYITVSWLHFLLLGILIFNIVSIGRSYLKHRNQPNLGLKQEVA